MTGHSISLAYANSLIFELEKAFYDERGKGARFRTTLVGRQYFEERCRPCLSSDDIGDIAGQVREILVADHLVDEFACKQEDRLLRIHIAGCVHRPVEEHMLACGVQPFTCMPGNLLGLALESRLDRPVELAEIKVDESGCDLLLVLFDKRPELVQSPSQRADPQRADRHPAASAQAA
jgi:hypothetical protein